MEKDTCKLPPHDATTWTLSAIVCIGVVASYVPQIVRIVSARSSVGLSPWFLFLGTTSSWCATFNVLVLQWPLLACTLKHVSWMHVEYWMGLLQTGLQQLMFTILFACFLYYYRLEKVLHRRRSRRRHSTRPVRKDTDTSLLHPPEQEGNDSSGSESDLESYHSHIHQSYGAVSNSDHGHAADTLATHARSHDDYMNIPAHMRHILERHLLPSEEAIHGKVGSVHEFQLARQLAWVATILVLVIVIVSVVMLGSHARRAQVLPWAAFLGVLGGLLAMCQYLPQILHTARARLVRSMSILTMCIQVPGAFVFIYTLHGREGVNWSSLLPYVVAALLQGILLVLCVAWKLRQRQEGIDDYGRYIGTAALHAS